MLALTINHQPFCREAPNGVGHLSKVCPLEASSRWAVSQSSLGCFCTFTPNSQIVYDTCTSARQRIIMLYIKQALRSYLGQSLRTILQSHELFLMLCLFCVMYSAHGQAPIDVNDQVLKTVMREADFFSLKGGDPPVYRGYKVDAESEDSKLIGYLFETSDYPPEEVGYSAPIDALVGVDLQGTLTGVKVLHYIESYKSIRGDFINSEYFPQQFFRKNIMEDFRVGRDIDGISRATITSWAVARGIRDAARKMARSYLPNSDYVASTSGESAALRAYKAQSWDDMIESGLVKEMLVIQPDLTELYLSLAFIGHDGLGELMVGTDDYSRADRDASNRSSEGKMLLVGIDGNSSQPFRQERMAIKQGDEIYPVERRRFVYAGSADAGKIKDRTRFAGAISLMPELDLALPFSILYSTEGVVGEFGGIHETEYKVPELALALSGGGPITPELVSPKKGSVAKFQYPEESVWREMLDSTRMSEVLTVLFICVLVFTAFVMKKEMLRWLALTLTLFYLGWMDGGFVSVSHITNGIKLGPSLFLNDLPLFIVIVFTVVTALLWGRIFCSSLCPFGALQDFITRIVPKQFRYHVSPATHDLAIYIKYAILAFLIMMALIYSDLSLFQYFEPFGTVFYFSRSIVLWIIAAGFLVGAVFIPRFYCRYACPLGASLGVVSLVSPFRIKRVQQCNVCKVCEHACPTGAIKGPTIDFKECVRCDICDYKLIAKAGVCKHDIETVKVRVKRWDEAIA